MPCQQHLTKQDSNSGMVLTLRVTPGKDVSGRLEEKPYLRLKAWRALAMPTQCNRTDSTAGRTVGKGQINQKFKKENGEKERGRREGERESVRANQLMAQPFHSMNTRPKGEPALNNHYFTLFSMFKHFQCLKIQKYDCNYSTYYIYIYLHVLHMYIVHFPCMLL